MARCDLDIELRHLRYFVAAAEQGSFRKAGKVLGVQKSAISRRIRDLEDRIGVTLFHRPAPAGYRLLTPASNSYREQDKA